jgi:mannobiose 2-epimerase
MNAAGLMQLKEEVQEELHAILAYWMKYTPDEVYGGFYGRLDNSNHVSADAPKGAVLNARILWAFSAAHHLTGNGSYLQFADRAYEYICSYFTDRVYGGIYWTVDHTGQPLETKKQVYAQAFLLYACCEYYKCNDSEAVLEKAQALYLLIEEKAFDKADTGYLEAFTREWDEIVDARLSAKDANEKKTMNTHLHVLEAYTNLYRVWPDESLKASIVLLLRNFADHIINDQTFHLELFFDVNWEKKSHLVSYGHDIEASWLLLEAAEVIGDTAWTERIRKIAAAMADAAGYGLDQDGGMWYEKENGNLITEKHSWVQAEAMVGFFNAWQITHDRSFLEKSLHSWRFIRKFIRDDKNGEWFWGVNKDGTPMQGQDKVGIWKCPYHNSRACIEMISRIRSIPEN